MAVCAVLAAGLVTLVAFQSQSARAASVGEFTMEPATGRLSDPQPFAGSIGIPGKCPDTTVEELNWNNFLRLYVVKADGTTEVTALNGISAGAPFSEATSAVSLKAEDNPGMAVADLAGVIAGDGTYELRVRCVDPFDLSPAPEDWVPGDPYWTQKITVTGDNWVVGEGAEATTTELTYSPSTPEPGQEVTLSATVGPAEAAGTVAFLDGETSLGQATVAGGKADLKTSALTEGPHRIVARFTPTDTTKWAVSESASRDVTVQAPRFEMQNASGERLPVNPELQRGQEVKLILRGCTVGTPYAVALNGNDTAFPAATADANGTVSWASLKVPDDAVGGNNAWKVTPRCGEVDTVAFTVPEPSESPSPTATDDPTGDPTDDPTDDPTADPTDDATDGGSGDTSGTTSGTTGGDGTSGTTGGTSGTGGTSPQGGLASTGSRIALFSGIGAVVLLAAGIFAVRFGRRNGLLTFGEPRP
ncbi:Ig-like domain-containing protein [Streptomyces sp. QTS52]